MTIRHELGITVPLVLAGFYRYQYLVARREGGESPTELFWSDVPLILIVLGWLALSVQALLAHPPG